MIRRRGKIIIFDAEDWWKGTSHTMIGCNKSYIIHNNKQVISVYDIDKNGKVSFERNIDEPLVVKGMLKEFDKFYADDILQFTDEFEGEWNES